MTLWEKKLYIRQSYPDNYTDPSFLSEMKKNGTPSNDINFTLFNSQCGDLL